MPLSLAVVAGSEEAKKALDSENLYNAAIYQTQALTVLIVKKKYEKRLTEIFSDLDIKAVLNATIAGVFFIHNTTVDEIVFKISSDLEATIELDDLRPIVYKPLRRKPSVVTS